MYSSAPSLELAARERPMPWKELAVFRARDQTCQRSRESRDDFFLNRTFFRNRIDGCRQDLCGGVTKSGARDRDGQGGRGWDAAGTSVVTAVANMPELAFGNAQVRRQEASGESRGTVLTLACAPLQAQRDRDGGRRTFSPSTA